MLHRTHRWLLVLSAALAPSSAMAAELRVGPNEPIQRIADAARLAQDGDTVSIQPGTYHGDVALWTQNRLTIRGLGAGAVLDAAGQSIEGKAIWVIRGGDIRIDNITFRGARVPHLNGAGIRFEHVRLSITNSRFIDNENGILTSNDPSARLHVENCQFDQAPRHPGALHHLLYVGQIYRFTLRGSRLQGGYNAHLVKTRARSNHIEYNWIVDGPDGEASYELEFPEGGLATVIGNTIGQSANTSNTTLISYGAEDYRSDDNRLLLSHNTLVNERNAGGIFLRVWPSQTAATPTVMARNNLLIGLGAFALGNPGEFIDNPSTIPPAASSEHAIDVRLAPDTLLRGHISAATTWHDIPLQPTHEFRHPTGTVALEPPQRWAPGAWQTPRPR